MTICLGKSCILGFRFGSNYIPLVRLEELKTFLSKQKYPPFLIDDSIAKLKALKRSDLLKQNE